MRYRITALFVGLMILVACGMTNNRFVGIWASNYNGEYIIFDENGNFSYIKLSYDSGNNGDMEKYISEANFGIVEDNTLLIDSRYHCDSAYTKYRTLDEIPTDEIIKLQSRQSIVIEFETDYVFAINEVRKFTKQAKDYEIPYTMKKD